MSDMLKVGTLSAEQGKKVQGYLEVAGTDVKMPMTLINGANKGKTVVITGGTHGGEYPGVEAAIRLAKEINPTDVSGRMIIIHPVNVPAFFAKTQYVGPQDGKNLNREFPGKATGTVTERIAYTISSQLFSQADLYLDLHGGDIHESLIPFVIYSKLGSKEQVEFSIGCSKALGVKYICGSVSENGTFGCAAKMGVPGFLGEIGNLGLWCEDEVKQYFDGVCNVLRFAEVLPGAVVENKAAVMIDAMSGLDAGKTGCWYPCVKIDDMVKKGDKVGEIKDCFGNLLEEYFAPDAGVMLYVIASLPIKEGEPIIAIGKN